MYYNRMAKRASRNILYLIILICIICGSLYLIRVKEGFQTNSPFDLVVARYEEDISWIKNIPEDMYSRMFIYNKGSDADFNLPKSVTKTLPNYGRESHTYLSHVIDNYDNLADITMFVPGSAWYRDDKQRRVIRITDYLRNNKDSIIIGHKDNNIINDTYNFSIDTWTVTNEENRKKNPDSKLTPAEDRPLRTWFQKRFPGESISCVSFTGILAVTRNDIQKRPVEFYKKLLEEHSSVNPEVVHYSERIWKNIFSIDDSKCIE
jgi:hypothetical protein